MFPSFLGIGAVRSGSTWLHVLLSSHPDVYLPEMRKELHYYDRNYHKGQAWYESWFPQAGAGEGYRAVGEITPSYMYCPQALERIRELKTVEKLLIILRNPVDRVYSHYRWQLRAGGTRGSFEQFLDEFPNAIDWSQYHRHLAPFVEAFHRDNVLVLISEEVFEDVATARKSLAEFLQIDETRFPSGAGGNRVNASTIARFGGPFRIARKLGRKLRDMELDWIVEGAKRLGVPRLFGKSTKEVPRLSKQQRDRLYEVFHEDIASLEELLERRIALWHRNEVNECSESQTSPVDIH